MYPVAAMSRTIKIISATVLILDFGFVVASFATGWALIPAVSIAAVALGCYLRAPVAYEASRYGLSIMFRMGSKRFGPVTRADRVEKPMGKSIRVWGNGGLFAATGTFWNSTWGTFKAYLTTSDQNNMVIVETSTGKVLLSPENPEEFLKGAAG